MKRSSIFFQFVACCLLLTGCDDSLIDSVEVLDTPAVSTDPDGIAVSKSDGGTIVFWASRLPKSGRLEVTLINADTQLKQTKRIATTWQKPGRPDCTGHVGSANFNLSVGHYIYKVADPLSSTSKSGRLYIEPGKCADIKVGN